MRNVDRPLIGPFTGKHILGLAGAMVAVVVILSLLTAPISLPTSTPLPTPGASFDIIGAPTVGLSIGDLAPEFTGTSDGQTVGLDDLQGNPIRLADYIGHPVWIDFFATWCPPCQEETPVLRDEYDAHKADGLALIAISVQETSPDDVRAYAQTYGLDYTIGFDATSAIFKTYQAYGLPTQLFVDRHGVIRGIIKGPLTQLQAEQILAPLIAAP